MNSWYSKALGDGVDAFVPKSEIQQAYILSATVTKLPTDCAVCDEELRK